MKIKAILITLLLFIFTACKDTTSQDPYYDKIGFYHGGGVYYPFEYEDSRDFTYKLMKEIYFWNEDLPEINPFAYATPNEVMAVLTAGIPQDKGWGYVETGIKESDKQSLGVATVKDYGFFPEELGDGTYRIVTVQPNSPFGLANIGIGDVIIRVNNEVVSSLGDLADLTLKNETLEFTIKTKEGVELAPQSITVASYTPTAVMHYKILDENTTPQITTGKTGYLVFDNFMTTPSELDPVFEEFRNKGVSQMIIDLRYNGGGYIQIADYFIDLLIGAGHGGKLNNVTVWNNRYSHWNEPTHIRNYTKSLNVEKVVFLTNEYTASASELMINALSPYIDVKAVGSITHGKPVGMPQFTYEKANDNMVYNIIPVAFALENSQGEGYYFDGMPVDSSIKDSQAYAYGEGEVFTEAVYYLENGVMTGSPDSPTPATRSMRVDSSRIRDRRDKLSF